MKHDTPIFQWFAGPNAAKMFCLELISHVSQQQPCIGFATRNFRFSSPQPSGKLRPKRSRRSSGSHWFSPSDLRLWPGKVHAAEALLRLAHDLRRTHGGWLTSFCWGNRQEPSHFGGASFLRSKHHWSFCLERVFCMRVVCMRVVN